MGNFMQIAFFMSTALLSAVVSANEAGKSTTFLEMLQEGNVSGNIRSIYAMYDQKLSAKEDVYATALGGHLKYSSAEVNGFMAAATFSTSNDLAFATGSKGLKHNSELSSTDGEYNTLSESYIKYNYDNFSFTAGRQVIDTPLANSDDIRMIYNTFEAYTATYALDGFNFIAGKLQKWQGYDAGLENGWIKSGEDGTYFGAVVYTNDLFEANAWYYNITELTDATYLDIKLNHKINSDISLVWAAQYLKEDEINNSGTKASIYGLLAEGSAYGFTLSAAYNRSQKKSDKASFSGFGGGALFTNMDTMILDEITQDRSARATLGGIAYEIDNISISYAYGDFKSKADSLGNKAHIIEQNIVLGYSVVKEKLSLLGIYALQEDKMSLLKQENDWNRFSLMLSYSF